MSKKNCFVIMPFGEKPNINGEILDFDEIYKEFIKPAVVTAGLHVLRCDEIESPGWIHAQMIKHIYNDDVVVVDITTLNANVFYELGVRQALRHSVTVLIRKKGTTVPFNILGLNVIEYDKGEKDEEEVKRKIGNYIKNGLKNSESDSLVHDVLNLKIEHQRSKPHKPETFPYRLVGVSGKEIGIVTGEIQHVTGIDIWVNSENTNMQMARFLDRSLSSVIRYLGARRNAAGHVIKDTIADELKKKMGSLKEKYPAEIIVTTSGNLEKMNDVKRVFHAASVTGAVGHGFEPISNIADCVTNALRMVDSPPFKDMGLTSILFPLFGTGQAQGDPNLTAKALIEAAITYFSTKPTSKIERCYFLAYSKDHLDACQRALDQSKAVRKVVSKAVRKSVRKPVRKVAKKKP